MRLSDLTEGLKVLTEKNTVHLGKRAHRAAVMGRKAQHRGDKQAFEYWKRVYQNAMKGMPGTPAHNAAQQAKSGGGQAKAPETRNMAPVGSKEPQGGGQAAPADKASGKPAGGGEAPQGGPEAKPGEHGSEHGEPVKKKTLSDRFKAAKDAVKSASKALADKIKSAPAATKKLLTDPVYRHAVGKKIATKLKHMPASIIHSVVDEVKEVGKAGLVVGKFASGKKLTHEDKHVLKAGAKALAMTVIGTVAIGGIAHLTASALAGHFAAETAVKAVGKAALYASLMSEAERSATTIAWVSEVIQGIKDGFDGLGDMDEEKLTEILSSVYPES